MSSKQTDVFETMSLPKAIAALGIPTIISQLVSMIYNMADTYFIGQTGDTNQVAAVTFGFPVFLCITAIANLFGIGGGSLVSRALGRKDHRLAKRASAFSLWAAVCATVILSACVWIFQKPLLRLLGVGDDTFAFTRDYLFYTVVLGGLPTMLNLLLAHLVRAVGASKQASIGMSLGGILNTVLDPVFIFGFRMQIAGAALATCLSNAIAAAYFVWYLYRNRKNSLLGFSLPQARPTRDVVGPVLTIGFPAAISLFMAILSNTVLNRLMAGYATGAIAAIGIVKKADMVPTHVVQGLSGGVLPLLAYNYASGNHKRMHDALRLTLIISVAFTLLGMLLYELFPHLIVRFFLDDEETIGYAVRFMRILCLSMPFQSVTFALTALFQAAGQGRQAMILSFMRKGFVDVPLMFVMELLLPLYGLVTLQPLLDGVSAATALTMYVRFRKRSMAIPDQKG